MSGSKSARRAALLCGIASPLLYIVTDVIAGTWWKGYDFIAQSMSDLSAVGAPTRPLVVPLVLIADLLIGIFGLSVWRAAGANRPLRIAGGLLVGNSITTLVAAFFPTHPGEAASTFANTMNAAIMGISVLCFLLAMGFGAAAYRNWFRFYSVGILLAFAVLTILGLYVFPRIGAEQPTPRAGIQERTMVFGYLQWAAALSVVLLRQEKRSNPT